MVRLITIIRLTKPQIFTICHCSYSLKRQKLRVMVGGKQECVPRSRALGHGHAHNLRRPAKVLGQVRFLLEQLFVFTKVLKQKSFLSQAHILIRICDTILTYKLRKPRNPYSQYLTSRQHLPSTTSSRPPPCHPRTIIYALNYQSHIYNTDIYRHPRPYNSQSPRTDSTHQRGIDHRIFHDILGNI